MCVLIFFLVLVCVHIFQNLILMSVLMLIVNAFRFCECFILFYFLFYFFFNNSFSLFKS
jgi:hypothetical protein